EPCHTTPHYCDFKKSTLQILPVHVGDLELSTSRGLQRACNLHNLRIVEVKPGYGISRLRNSRLLFKADRFALRIELNDPISLRIVNRIRKDSRPFFALRGFLHAFREIVPIENVVPENERAASVHNEVLGD